MPKVSIVTISYNQRAFLSRCIRSVEGQDFDDYEHIVVDAGSSDGSRELLETAEVRNLHPVFKEDSGPAEGLNNGLAASGGEIFIYVNSDDELAPGALSSTVEYHESLRQVDVLIGNGWTIDKDGTPIRYIRSDRFSPARYAASIANVMQTSTSFKMRLFEDGLRFNEDNKCVWDTELLFDAHKAGAVFGNVKDCLSYFRLHDASITVSKRYQKDIEANEQRLLTNSIRPTSVPMLRQLSLPSRLGKRAKNEVLNRIERPAFPGLV